MIQTRVLTAIVLVLIFGAALFKFDLLQWVGFILFATFWAGWEWAGLASVKNKLFKLLYTFIVTTTSYLLYVYFNDSFIFLLVPIEVAVMVLMVTVYQLKKGKRLVGNSLVLLLGFFSILPFSLSMIAFREIFSPELLLLCLAVIWAIDIGAFFSGRRFGKRKLASFVSPGKTWEGVLGGFLFALVVAYFGLYFIQPYILSSVLQVTLVLAGIGLLSIYGDLFESLLKRQANIKDSGALLPGHGGILDRIDSLLLAMPIFYVFWLWVS